MFSVKRLAPLLLWCSVLVAVSAPARVDARPLAPTPAVASHALDRLRQTLPQIDHNHVFVRFRARSAAVDARIARVGARVENAIPGTPWTSLRTLGDAVRVRQQLARDPAIAQVSLSYIRHATTVPNDTLYASKQSDYLGRLRMDRAWDLSQGSNVTVAVVDTGVDSQHPDLAGRVLSGTDIVPTTNTVQDDNGHGTMVAGVIAADINNTRGVAGIAPHAKILPIKVLDEFGSGNDDDIASGITYAATHGAQVINLSLGGPGGGDVLCAAVNTALSDDVVVVAAAGNDASESVGFPAACPGVIAVSATNHTNALTSFSSWGSRVDIAAPGLDITSTALSVPPTNNTYDTESGTSFSSPIVAGVAALVRAQTPGLTQAQVRDRMLSTARDVGPPGVDRAFGHGVVDPLAALGGPALAPDPALPPGGDEPNDTPAAATPLAVASAHAAQIAPETDEDWYDVNLASGWWKVHVPSGSGALDHNMDPIVRLYDASEHFLASQEFSGIDLVFNITAPGHYLLRVANRGGDTAPYTITVSSVAQPPLYGSLIPLDLASTAQSVAVGDLDNDHRNDIAFLMGDASGFADTVVVLSQTAMRSFTLEAAAPVPEGTAGGGMVIADIDNDGKNDVVFPTTGGVGVIPQGVNGGIDGSLGFTIRTTESVSQLAVGDIDTDDQSDLVTAGPSGVKVHWGSGGVSTVSGTAATSIALSADNTDIAAVEANKVGEFTYNGSQTFSTVTPFTLAGASNVAFDGANDVAVSVRASTGALRVLHQDAGTLTSSGTFTNVGADPEPIAVAGNNIGVMHDSSGNFGTVAVTGGSEQHFLADDEPSSRYDERALAFADIDGDDNPDVVIGTDFGVSLLMHRMDTLPRNYGRDALADVAPANLATNVDTNVTPTLTLTDAATNALDANVVTLVDGSGATVPATITANALTDTVTITPQSALAPGAYTIHVEGLQDASNDELSDFRSSFIVGAAPDETAPSLSFVSPPSGFRAVASTTIAFTSNDGTATFVCSRDNAVLAACTSPLTFNVAPGPHTFRVIARDAAGNERVATASWTYRPPPSGYWMLGAAGHVYPFGTVSSFGNAPLTFTSDIESSASGFGYWIVDMMGHVYSFGDAGYFGNAGALLQGEVVTSISRTATGNGYWLFTSRGRVFARGDAHFFGDLSSKTLNGPVLDSIRTASGNGYYMVASDGGVFTFGDAHFFGSLGNTHISAPIRTLAPDSAGGGYWLVGTDGAIYPFHTISHGSMAGRPLNKPVVGMVPFGNGYLMVASDGGIFDFSNKPFFGSLGAHPPAIPIASVAAFSG